MDYMLEGKLEKHGVPKNISRLSVALCGLIKLYDLKGTADLSVRNNVSGS